MLVFSVLTMWDTVSNLNNIFLLYSNRNGYRVHPFISLFNLVYKIYLFITYHICVLFRTHKNTERKKKDQKMYFKTVQSHGERQAINIHL